MSVGEAAFTAIMIFFGGGLFEFFIGWIACEDSWEKNAGSRRVIGSKLYEVTLITDLRKQESK